MTLGSVMNTPHYTEDNMISSNEIQVLADRWTAIQAGSPGAGDKRAEILRTLRTGTLEQVAYNHARMALHLGTDFHGGIFMRMLQSEAERSGPPVPAIYEIDPDTEEANGTVHPFCSIECRNKAQWKTSQEIVGRGFEAKIGINSPFDDGTICEACGKPV